MRNLDGLTKMTMAVLLTAVWASEARADHVGARLVAAWKDADPQHGGRRRGERLRQRKFVAGPIEGRPVYCPPQAAALPAPN